jgi:hypothetical protein
MLADILLTNKDAEPYSAQNWQFLAKTLGRNKIEFQTLNDNHF